MKESVKQQLIEWAEKYNDPVYFQEDPVMFPRKFAQDMAEGRAVLQDVREPAEGFPGLIDRLAAHQVGQVEHAFRERGRVVPVDPELQAAQLLHVLGTGTAFERQVDKAVVDAGETAGDGCPVLPGFPVEGGPAAEVFRIVGIGLHLRLAADALGFQHFPDAEIGCQHGSAPYCAWPYLATYSSRQRFSSRMIVECGSPTQR